MKKLLSLLLLLSTLTACLLPLTACSGDMAADSTTAATTEAPEAEKEPTVTLPLNILAFNLRYETKSHPLLSLDYRGPRFLEVVDKYDPDSISLCEATNDWMNFLRTPMSRKGYAYVGVGRDKGADSPDQTGSGNEHNPIFYKEDKLDLLEGDTIWLSSTPTVPGSKSWGSSITRICTYAVLKDKATGLTYAHLSTHLDHVSSESQYNAVRVIQMKMQELKGVYGDIGMVLSGDFNAVSFDQSNPAYRPTTYNFTTSFMNDSAAIAKKIGVQGSTTNGYTDPIAWENGQSTNVDMPAVDHRSSPIDYIFVSKGLFDVSYYTVVNDTFTFEYEGRTFHNHPLSDHYGVFSQITYTPGSSEAPNESKCIDVKATLSTDLPATLSQKTDLIADATLTSGLSCAMSNGINQLKGADSYAQLPTRMEGTQNYWEITAKLDSNSTVAGISILYDQISRPFGAECFISANGSDWLKVGESYLNTPDAGQRLTWELQTPQDARYVKVVLLACGAGSRLASLSVYGDALGTGAIELSPVSGPKSGAKEGYEKIIDGNTSTKFYMNIVNDEMFDLVFKSSKSETATSYTLTTANDHTSFKDRLPLGWTLYGSTNGTTWYPIDTVTDPDMDHTNYTTYEYIIDKPGEYSYYKLSFTLADSGKMQFSEFELLK